jgi:hypothetical protein
MSTNKIYADLADRVLLRAGVVDRLPDFFVAVPVLDAVFFGFTVLASFLRLLDVDLLVVAAFDVGVLRVVEVDRPLDADLLLVPAEEEALAVFFLAAVAPAVFFLAEPLLDLERDVLFVAEDVPAFFVRVTLLLRRSVFSVVGVDFFASADGFFLSEDLYNQTQMHGKSIE